MNMMLVPKISLQLEAKEQKELSILTLFSNFFSFGQKNSNFPNLCVCIQDFEGAHGSKKEVIR